MLYLEHLMKWFLFTLLSIFIISCTTSEEEPKKELKYPAWETSVNSSFSSSILRSSSFENGKLSIVLGESSLSKNYLTTGDKINKLLAIESARLFYKTPEINSLDIIIDASPDKYHLSITKAELESYYGINFEGIREHSDTGELTAGDLWKNDFIRIWDNKESRANFVNIFVKME
jgi:hypothetical protein